MSQNNYGYGVGKTTETIRSTCVEIAGEAPSPQIFSSILHAGEITSRLHDIALGILDRLDGQHDVNQVIEKPSSFMPGAIHEITKLVESLLALEHRLSEVAVKIG